MRRDATRLLTRLPMPATLKRPPHSRTKVEENKNTFEAASFHLSQFLYWGICSNTMLVVREHLGRGRNVFENASLMRARLSTGAKPVGYRSHPQCRGRRVIPARRNRPL